LGGLQNFTVRKELLVATCEAGGRCFVQLVANKEAEKKGGNSEKSKRFEKEISEIKVKKQGM